MYNEKHELCHINFSGKVPVIIVDDGIVSTKYNIAEGGTLHDLQDTLLKNINSDYKEEGLLKKKSALFSFLYKKPKEK